MAKILWGLLDALQHREDLGALHGVHGDRELPTHPADLPITLATVAEIGVRQIVVEGVQRFDRIAGLDPDLLLCVVHALSSPNLTVERLPSVRKLPSAVFGITNA